MEKILMQFNEINTNGRIYSRENIDTCLEELNNKINSIGCLYGELGHPTNLDISLSRVSHSIKNLRIENDALIGDVTLLDTPYGRICNALDENFSISVRGVGKIDEDGTIIIEKIISFDIIGVEPQAENLFNLWFIPNIIEEEYNRVYSDIDPYGEEDWKN